MDGVNVIAGVTHTQPVPLALVQVEYGWNYLANHRVRYAIDRPSIEAFLSGIVFGECHSEGLVRQRGCRARFRETCVVPLERRRSNPLCFSGVPRVLDYDPHAILTIVVIEIP